MGLPVVALLQLLEAATGVGFCHHCCNLGPHCKCVGASQLVSPTLWSQIMEQTPGYGVTTSSGGMITPSTSVTGMLGYVVPPLGFIPPDFSIWSLPPLEASLPGGLPTVSQCLPPVGRFTQMRAALEGMLGCSWCRVQGLQHSRLRCHLHWCCVLLRWHHLSVSHHPAAQQLRTSRRYHCQASLPGGESLSTPLPTKLPPPVVKALRATGDRVLEVLGMIWDENRTQVVDLASANQRLSCH